MFTWIPIHREAVRKMLELPQPQKEILAVLREMEQRQLKVTGLNDRGGDTVFPLREIDPLTFLAMFNRGISKQNRQHNWQFLKARWHLSSDVPEDFDGIPTVNNQSSWFFPYSDKRGKQDVERLWQLVRQVADRTPEQVDGSLFDQCLQIGEVGIHKLTIGMFWVNPDQFLTCGKKTRSYGQKKDIHGEPKDYASYCEWMSQVSEAFGEKYPKLSHNAHLWAMRKPNGVPAPKPYTKQAAMQGLFLSEAQFDEAIDALREKKNIVLQGPPGVGKTFVARRLAKALIGSDDPQRIEMIQFHQSYSYEDFIQGFRPTTKGTFDLRDGVFHQFCRRARRDEATDQKYVFVIDEINRGNLSKIFGELMMLVEPDKRGSEFAIPLAYASDSSDKFYIPENLYLIGTMNTADRSLAMVDYALRRRFRFFKLRPEFASGDFSSYLESNGVPPGLVRKIVERMKALNKVIAADTKNLGPGYEIGHSYFCPRNSEHLGDGWYERIVSHEIVPLIQEYWFDDEKKVDEQRKALLL